MISHNQQILNETASGLLDAEDRDGMKRRAQGIALMLTEFNDSLIRSGFSESDAFDLTLALAGT